MSISNERFTHVLDPAFVQCRLCRREAVSDGHCAKHARARRPVASSRATVLDLARLLDFWGGPMTIAELIEELQRQPNLKIPVVIVTSAPGAARETTAPVDTVRFEGARVALTS